MKYISVQFRDAIVFTTAPWMTMKNTFDATGGAYTVEDDGPDHITVSRGDVTMRVPWSNVTAALPWREPVAKPAEVPALRMPLVVKGKR